MMDEMEARWRALWLAHERPQQVAAVWQDIVALYTGNGRFYHNLNHIQRALDTAVELQAVTADYRAVMLALWFHDVIYDAAATDNEALSAVYARQALAALGEDAARIEHVAELILATVHRATAVADPDMQVVLDADLATLASPAAEYDSYSRAIRREFAHVDDAAYRDGRMRVMHHFLNRTPLFFSQPMQPRTAAAHANMRRELDNLLANHS